MAMPHGPRLFLLFLTFAVSLSFIGQACGGDDPAASTSANQGGGGMGIGGESIGGFMPNTGSGGMGGMVNEGGTGELTHAWSNVHGDAGANVTPKDIAIDSAPLFATAGGEPIGGRIKGSGHPGAGLARICDDAIW